MKTKKLTFNCFLNISRNLKKNGGTAKNKTIFHVIADVHLWTLSTVCEKMVQ